MRGCVAFSSPALEEKGVVHDGMGWDESHLFPRLRKSKSFGENLYLQTPYHGATNLMR